MCVTRMMSLSSESSIPYKQSSYQDLICVSWENHHMCVTRMKSLSPESRVPYKQSSFHTNHQFIHPKNQVVCPKIQVFYPRNQVFYPKNQVSYPKIQVFHPKNQDFCQLRHFFPSDPGNLLPRGAGLNTGTNIVSNVTKSVFSVYRRYTVVFLKQI